MNGFIRGMSKRTTVTLHEKHVEQIDEIRDRDDSGDLGQSEAVRRIFDRAREADALSDRVGELEHRVDELREQLAEANTRIDASNEVVRYVEEERSIEARRRQAGVLTRARWWISGMPIEDDSAGAEG